MLRGASMTMLVRFNEISPHGTYYDIRAIEGVGEDSTGLAIYGPVEAWCTLTRKDDATVELQGELKTVVTVGCDRCLSPYHRPVDIALQMLFEVESDQGWHIKDVEYRIQDLDTVVLDEPVVDLDDVFRQQLYLALPMKSLCSEQCKGICPNCGANRNHEACGCADTRAESPFSVLAQLKKE